MGTTSAEIKKLFEK